MAIPVSCPQCSSRFRVSSQHLGSIGKCPECSARFKIEASAEASSAPSIPLDTPEASSPSRKPEWGRFGLLLLGVFLAPGFLMGLSIFGKLLALLLCAGAVASFVVENWREKVFSLVRLESVGKQKTLALFAFFMLVVLSGEPKNRTSAESVTLARHEPVTTEVKPPAASTPESAEVETAEEPEPDKDVAEEAEDSKVGEKESASAEEPSAPETEADVEAEPNEEGESTAEENSKGESTFRKLRNSLAGFFKFKEPEPEPVFENPVDRLEYALGKVVQKEGLQVDVNDYFENPTKKIVLVRWRFDGSSFSGTLDAARMMRCVHESGFDLHEATFFGLCSLVDQYGHTGHEVVFKANFKGDTVSRVNWADEHVEWHLKDKVVQLAEYIWLHDAVKKEWILDAIKNSK